ncbi:MAG: hypothetical protein Q8O90_09890 [Elusimicrobiota bacterium]|nr:hypothetical protein [Elusimicrobiota bacterium]
MEKEKLVHYVPADMVNRLKKLLVRLWETRNPASAYLSAILNDVELEVRSLNETILDISSRERNTTIREKEKNWMQEKEKLQTEAERGLEELRASAAARLEKTKVSFACEKAELSEANSRAQREIEALASENRKMSERAADQENELKKRLFEAKAEYERESGRRVQKTVEEITGRLLLALNAAEKKNEDAAAEAARSNKEIARLKEALAEKARQSEEIVARQAEEIEVKEHDLASLRATARELERRIAELNEAHQAELKDKLRAKESELNKAAAERLEMERGDREAQGRRQEGVLAKMAEDLKEAQREIGGLTAENRRLSDRLAGQEGELERRLFEAKSEFERESGRRVQAAVEEVSGRLLASLNAAEKKKDESLSEAAHAKEECSRLKDALAERARQFRESCEWQAAEAAEKDKYLASSHEKVKELEKKIISLGDEHHAELMDKLRGKEAEFRSRQDKFEEEFEKERAGYLKSLAGLKAGHEEEKSALEEEGERLKAKLGEKYAELEAGLKASLDARAAELERDYAARRAALAGELRGKEAELDREAAERLEFERATWEAQSRRQESLLAQTAEDFKRAQKEIEVLTAENRKVNELISEMARSAKFKNEDQFNEAVARERERLAADHAGQLAAFQAGVKEKIAAFQAKEKAWAAEKEKHESEISLCSVSTRSFVAEQTLKMKADLAKWKEALEEEYKARLTEQLRAKDVELISERSRLAQEFLEKYAAMEARLEGLKAGKLPGPKKKPGEQGRQEGQESY